MPMSREKWDSLSEDERFFITVGIEETYWSQSQKAVRHRVLLTQMDEALRVELEKSAEMPDWPLELLDLLARVHKELNP
jgi:hypothetical protein